MKIFLALCTLSIALQSSDLLAQVKRTDGPPGSEYGDSNIIEGEIQIGLHFGALLKQSASEDTSFTLGADIDWRPFDLFGFRIAGLQGLQEPRSTLISLLPMAHTEFSNLRPYAVFGPGIGIIESNVKFSIVGGLGADVMLNDRFGIGMEYVYHSVLDFKDLHFLGARLVLAFPPKW